MLDEYQDGWQPRSSDHLNGIIFERSNLGRSNDSLFGDIASTCEFLAKYHHNENNLKILSDRYMQLMTYASLKRLTSLGDEFNAVYGSQYGISTEDGDFRFPT